MVALQKPALSTLLVSAGHTDTVQCSAGPCERTQQYFSQHHVPNQKCARGERGFLTREWCMATRVEQTAATAQTRCPTIPFMKVQGRTALFGDVSPRLTMKKQGVRSGGHQDCRQRAARCGRARFHHTSFTEPWRTQYVFLHVL